MPGSHEVSRRGFATLVTGFVGVLIGAVVGLPAIGYLLSPALKVQKSESRIALGPLENYPAGVPTLFSFTRSKVNGWEKTVNSYGVYVLHTGAEVKAFSNICTHLSCRVTWKEDQQIYKCPCHDASFDIHAAIIKGPQPKPLNEYPVSIEDGSLYMTFTGG